MITWNASINFDFFEKDMLYTNNMIDIKSKKNERRNDSGNTFSYVDM